jgi:hypothetical protein
MLAGAFDLKEFEVFKAYSAEECLNKVDELGGKVDLVFVDGKIAADRGAWNRPVTTSDFKSYKY